MNKRKPKICSCSVNGDHDLSPTIKNLAKAISTDRKNSGDDSDIVNILGELEATDHERTCTWYGIFLEECELRCINI